MINPYRMVTSVMSTAAAIGRNIQAVRSQRGMTQRDIYEATGISTSQLSSYENGKQMVGLVTLAKIATALDTSIDRLYFGAPSEAFLNETEDFGETVVNCFKKLRDLDVVTGVSSSGGASLKKCQFELSRLFNALHDYEWHKDYYPESDKFLEQIYKSTANEIDEKYEQK